MAVPAGAPVDNLQEVDWKTVRVGDIVYTKDYDGWFGLPGVAWLGPAKIARISERPSTPTTDSFILCRDLNTNHTQLLQKGPNLDPNDHQKIYKQFSLDPVLKEKLNRQKLLALQNSKIGFEGLPMKIIGEHLGVKKLPNRLARKRRATRDRRNRSRRNRTTSRR